MSKQTNFFSRLRPVPVIIGVAVALVAGGIVWATTRSSSAGDAGANGASAGTSSTASATHGSASNGSASNGSAADGSASNRSGADGSAAGAAPSATGVSPSTGAPDPTTSAPAIASTVPASTRGATSTATGAPRTGISSSTATSQTVTSKTAASTSTKATTSTPSCTPVGTIRIAAAPGVDNVLRDVARASCITLTLTEAPAAKGASLLADGSVDAWVPDSRQYAYAAGAKLAAAAPSVAWSPVVMAGPVATVDRVTTPAWGALLPGQGTIDGISVGIQNRSSGASMALAGALTGLAMAKANNDRYLGLAGAAGAITRMKSTPVGGGVAAGTLQALEQRLAKGLAEVPTAEGVPILDAPWISDKQQNTKIAAIQKIFLTSLGGAAGSKARAAHGFLEPGVKHVTLSDGVTVPALSGIDMSLMGALFGLTGEGLRPGNTLAVMDVSGSMGERVTGQRMPAIEGVKSSAPLMIAALGSDTKLGLWEFGYQLDPPNDYIDLAPMAELGKSKQTFLDWIDNLQPKKSGTSLNSTVLAAYKHVQANYDPSRTNLIAIFTDGRDEDAPSGIDLPTLRRQLAAVADPQRPIGILFFGYGDVDSAAMKQIVAADGGFGGVWHITVPEQIIGVLMEATGSMASFSR